MRKLILLLMLIVTACGAQSTPAVPSAANTQAPPVAAVASPTSAPQTAPTSATQPISKSTNQPAATTNFATETTTANGDRVLGKPDAPVTLTDYSDFL